MPKLTNHSWKAKYTPDNTSNIVEAFYIPALRCANRYWRTTGYFQATALAMALRGIEGLIQNQGTMRMIVGCTLDQKEIDAIQKGMNLRTAVNNHFAERPLEPPNDAVRDALELLAWMIQHNFLDIKIALVCDGNKQPVGGTRIFHEKTGIIEDAEGNRIAFTGGVNETPQGWRWNWDSIHVHTSWKTVEHVDEDEISFSRLWNDQASNALVTDIPNAVRNDLLRFAPPADEFPNRLKGAGATYNVPPVQPAPEPSPTDYTDPRTIVWSYISQAPTLVPDGECVGEATSAVTPWPHQVRAFNRMWNNWPPKLLIADEVGLGKTIQAGLILRQAWMSGRANRILVMTPASVLKQWQIELREKFNLNWPIYDGKALQWYPSPGFQGPVEKPVGRDTWHQEPFVLVSSHLMRRRDRLPELLEQAEPWDLIVLDEAHHARRSGGIQSGKLSGPNRLLTLMQRLKARTQGLVLLTATPMQVDPIEVWDLLQLLGVSPEWDAEHFLRFFKIAASPAPSHEEMAYLARLFRAIERDHGPISDATAERLAPGQSRLKAKKILRKLRDGASIPLQQLETEERKAAIKIMQAHTPVRVLISRHTRELLRKYYEAGKLSTPIARRDVKDEFIALSDAERQAYDAVEDYISTTYNNAATGQERNAVGFVMTIYRRRLASSFYALANTLADRLTKLQGNDQQLSLLATEENLPDDLAFGEETPDLDEAAQLEATARNLEETADLQDLLEQVRALPTDTKALKLEKLLTQLQRDGYRQVIIFTQFTDTLDFLRQHLVSTLGLSIMCFSGRGGELQERDGRWRKISREETKQRFRNQEAEILLCTDAAAEGLNFQFCGALVNYDMPWNPMRVEQRIGRIDRLGQTHPLIRIYNLHYENTVETDVYIALRDRINLFETFVGRLQPILAKLTGAITNLALASREERDRDRETLLAQIQEDVLETNQQGFDLDAVTADDLEEPIRPQSAYTLNDLHSILMHSTLLPPGTTVTSAGKKDFAYLCPGMARPIRVTTDPNFFDENSDSVELWSPGSPLFPDTPITQIHENVDKLLFQHTLQQ